jgi:3'-5' exoribonuclease
MMNEKKSLGDFSEDQTVSGIFVISQAQSKKAKNGPYWHLTLTGRAGSIEARIWFPQSQSYEDLKVDQFVEVNGRVETYNGVRQMRINSMAVLDPVERGLDMADFIPTSAVPPARLLEEMEAFLHAELAYKPWSALCKSILRDESIRTALLSAPGAKTIHHAYAGGLLEHTLAIMRICRALSELYPQVDKEILLVGALCHDLGKAFELSHGVSREYTDAGRLLGHIQIGLELLEPFLRKTRDLPEDLAMHLKHIIVAHHGELAYGSPCVPQTMEAFILHYADNLDSKINTVQGALTTPEGEEEIGRASCRERLFRAV